jgi:DNA-binding IclR family transcriptional regulator
VEIVRKMGLVKYTPKATVDPKKFLKEMEEAKKKGYAIDHEEYMLGVRAVAAPIQSPSFPPAGIWVVGFASSLNDQKIEKVVIEIRKAAQEISRSLNPVGG